MTSRSALWTLIVISGLLRLGWAASLGLGNDEAYYYLFSVHRDWSLLRPAADAGAGRARRDCAVWRGRLGVQPARGIVLLFGASTWLLDRLTARYYGPRAGFLAALALNVTAYHTSAAACFALPDGPLLFFLAAHARPTDNRARATGKTLPWLAVGLAWGGALLSKYHAVVPAGRDAAVSRARTA